MPPTLSMIMGTKASIRTHGLACPMCKCGLATLLRPWSAGPCAGRGLLRRRRAIRNAGRADRELQTIYRRVPDEARKVATDHQALGYLRKEYGIEVVGRSYRRSRRWRPAQRRWPLQERALRRRASRPSREYNGEPADGEPAGAGPGIRVVLDLHRSLSEPGRAYCDHVELGAQQRVANGRLEALRQVPPSPRLAARSACSLSAPQLE